MDHDSMNRAKMRAEAALADAVSLLYVMLDNPVEDLDELVALRRVVRRDAVVKGLLKPTSLVAEPTVAEQINGGTAGAGEISITATLDVVSGDNNNDDIPEFEQQGEEDNNEQ